MEKNNAGVQTDSMQSQNVGVRQWRLQAMTMTATTMTTNLVKLIRC